VKRRELVRLLLAAGFVLVRSRGPHDVFGKEALRIAVPRHIEIKEHLARKILREAGIRDAKP
jgi:predicted RNA binding protein YcfA (HicA-like mRNA interferase family)